MKFYQLKKDLPGLPAGVVFIQEKDGAQYQCAGWSFSVEIVEKTPEWFEVANGIKYNA